MLRFSGVKNGNWQRDRGGAARHIAGALALTFLLPALGACAPVVGGGVLLAVVAIGAATTHCYDYADVTVYDPTGHRTCAATVTAKSGGDEFELKSCYYAPLTDGVWTIRASLPGLPEAKTTVQVDHANDCTRHVQSMELTINAGSSAAPAPALPPPLPPPPASPAPLAPVAPPAPDQPASPAPVPSGVAPAPTTAAPAPAAPTGAPPAQPPVGVFPEAPPGAHPSPPK